MESGFIGTLAGMLGVEHIAPDAKSWEDLARASESERLTRIKLSLVGLVVRLMQVKDMFWRVRHSQGVRKDIPP
ncbi:hypothetical protein DBR12_18275 [Acidovorax sp. HMWF029]|nr:hypothetical protein DBR12_18275 [Acidovorax sp. HMWF029]